LFKLYVTDCGNINKVIKEKKESETYIKIRSNGQRKSRQIIEKENYIGEKMIEYIIINY